MTIYYENPDTWGQVKVGDHVTVFKAVAGCEKLTAIMAAAKKHAYETLDCLLNYYSPYPYDTVVYEFYTMVGNIGYSAKGTSEAGKHVGEKYDTGNVVENCKALSGTTTRLEFDDLNADED